MMKVIKFIVLETLLLIVMLLCGTATMKILDLLLKLGYENIWKVGFKVGFIAWLSYSLATGIVKLKNKNKLQFVEMEE